MFSLCEKKVAMAVVVFLFLLVILPMLACGDGGDVQFADATPIDVATPAQ